MKNKLSSEQIKDFLFAGNAKFTIESTKTNNHYTYLVKKASMKDENSVYFVSILSGPDNTSSFSYIGIITRDKVFRHTQKSKVSTDTISFKAFNYFFNQVVSNKIKGDINVYHSGVCGRCGRLLTTPSSVTSGFGPICKNLITQHKN